MSDLNIVNQAMEFATNAHQGQTRKFGPDRPYIYHPHRVYMHLSRRHPDNYELLAAALLHDVVEDCGVSLDELFKLFGAGVAILVWEVSHPETPPGMPRRERWPIYLEHFASASVNGQTLKLADRYRNLREYVDFWDSLPEKERKFIRGVYRKETIELIDRIGGVDKETTAKIIDTMMEIMGNLR